MKSDRFGLLFGVFAPRHFEGPLSGGRGGRSSPSAQRRALRLFVVLLLVFGAILLATVPTRAAPPEGQLTWAVQVGLAPAWFDPAEATGILIPFMVYYALHDALVKPMPGNAMAPSLAESWSVSSDGLTYEFVLRQGVRFHNGDLLTADDVKFSFERYRGVSAKSLKDRVRQVQVIDAHRVRFQLKEPWPDFLAFYATPATGAAWIVPRKYVEKIGDEGFKKTPVGAGPYRFVSFNPGVELVLDAHEQYWRKSPSVKRLVLRAVPDELTRVAMLKRGEVDIAYALRGPVAEAVQRTPGLTLKPVQFYGEQWLLFTDQWDPKSRWADRRVRLAVNHAIDRQAMNQSFTLGFSRMTGSIIPRDYEFSWPAPPTPTTPGRQSSFWRRPGTHRGSMPVNSGPTPDSPTTPKRSRTISRRSASARESAPSSARPTLLSCGRRSPVPSCTSRARRTATRQRGSTHSWLPEACTPTEAIPTFKGSFRSRPPSAIESGERRCCTRSSSSYTNAQCSCRSGISPS